MKNEIIGHTEWTRAHSEHILQRLAVDVYGDAQVALGAVRELNKMYGYDKPAQLIGESSIVQIVTEVVRQLEHK